MRRTILDGLMEWSAAILDRLMHLAPDEHEAALATTAFEIVLPALAIRWHTTANDNHP